MVHFDLQLFAADGHLSFDTRLDEKGFSGGIKKLGSIAKGGLSILGGAVAGVTAAMGAGVTAGMKYNAYMQMYMANFSTMLGSQEAATKFVDQLKETAAKTPFEMSDLADASKTLLAFGSTADGANDQIKMLGDISLGNAEKLKTLSTAFGRIQSNGKASMEELNMMIDSGFNPLNIIAAKTGESMESLRKRVSSGGVSFEELNEAMVQATSEGGQFYKGMEKASMTMDGLISTLKDNAMALLGEVVQPLTDQMTDTLLPAAIDTIDQLSQAFREGGVEGLIQAGADILGNLLIGIADQLPGVIETAVSFIDTLIQSFNENMPLLLEELQNLGPQAAAQIQLMTEMSDDQLDEYVSLFRQKNRIARKQAVDELKPMREEISDQIMQMQQETSAELAKYQKEYTAAMTELGVSLNQPLENMKLAAAQNAVVLVSAMAGAVKEASGTAENMAQFEAIAQNVLGAVGDLPASMSDVGKQAITDMIEGIKSMSGQLYNTVQTVVSSALQGAAQALLGGGIEAAMADVGNVTGSISTPASAYGNEGYGPGYAMDYRRMGQEMAAAMDGVAVNMDGTAVGSVVSGPVNNNLGSYNVTGGRSMH